MMPFPKIHDLHVARVVLATVLLVWAVLVGLDAVRRVPDPPVSVDSEIASRVELVLQAGSGRSEPPSAQLRRAQAHDLAREVAQALLQEVATAAAQAARLGRAAWNSPLPAQ